ASKPDLMVPLGPAQIIKKLIEVLGAAKRNSIARSERQISGKRHIRTVELRCCVRSCKIKRRSDRRTVERLIIVQTVECRLKLIYYRGTEDVRQISEGVLVVVTV